MTRRFNLIEFEDVKGLDSMLNQMNNMKERITCAICQGIICDPVQCPEEHAYCSRCIDKWGGNCPQCRRGTFKKARLIRELLSNLSVYCYYCQKELKYDKYIECQHSEEDLYGMIKKMVKDKQGNSQTHYHILEKQNTSNLFFKCGTCEKMINNEMECYKCNECTFSVCKNCFEN